MTEPSATPVERAIDPFKAGDDVEWFDAFAEPVPTWKLGFVAEVKNNGFLIIRSEDTSFLIPAADVRHATPVERAKRPLPEIVYHHGFGYTLQIGGAEISPLDPWGTWDTQAQAQEWWETHCGGGTDA